jgi:hypothetical protein
MSLLNPHAYSKGVVNNWNNIESGIKHEPPDLHVYSKGVVNNWYIIESGKNVILLKPPAYSSGVVFVTLHYVSIIYHSCAVGMEVQEAHVLCHFQ